MGCQMNEYDSDSLAQSLINDGFFPTSNLDNADLILINTCAVRAKPEQKAFSFLGRLAGKKKNRPGLVIGMVGCLAQMHGSSLLKRFPYLDFVIGPGEVGNILEVVKKAGPHHLKVVATSLCPAPHQPISCQGYFSKRVTGFISVMEGCDNFCSYCIVPYVRGREISRSPAEISAEAKDLVSQGVRDLTLLGQNVNSFRWEGEITGDFPSLLHELSGLNGLYRLRFTTSHPKDLSDNLIQCFRDIKELCPHIHLPFQAGSNRVLERMRRSYTREHYLELIRKLRAAGPDIAITSDVMVGFPGETDDDFELTLDLIKEVQFDSLFSFKYSDRKGTSAERMGEKVEDNKKAYRLNLLQGLQKEITLRKNKDLEGKRLEVLVEGVSKRGGQLTGRTASNKVVNFIGNNNQIGKLIPVKIYHSSPNSLQGEATTF